MVTMEARRPMTAMAGGRGHPAGELIRTDGVPSPAGPARLTRSGRIVMTGVAALIIGMASVALATAAQATRTVGGVSSPGRYIARVVVRQGQSLWTLAEAYDPDADPRLIVADIEQLNSMTGDQLQPGQALWVPRG